MDLTEELQGRLEDALSRSTSLCIEGGGTKGFYGRAVEGETLSTRQHRGIVSYEPTELVITARAGTPLAEVEDTLASHGQMLGFEPPHFGVGATLGGTIACGLSGPRRPYAGSARDFVLGVKLLNGRGQVLSFGGQVMKNVAGYDLSRLVTGSLGTLGVILEVSLKVLPVPAMELTRGLELSAEDALERMNALAALPLSGVYYDGRRMYLRLSGAATAVHAAVEAVGGEEEPAEVWARVREQDHPFFAQGSPLWRLSVPPASPQPGNLSGEWLFEWGGALRWLRTDAPAARVRAAAQSVGGHATLFRGGDASAEPFHPLPEEMLGLHRRIKAAMDPQGILNPGRMYSAL